MKYVRWTPHRLARLRSLLLEGKSNPEIAEIMKISQGAVGMARVRHGLDMPPKGYVFVADLAHELGMSHNNARRRLQSRGVELRPWGAARYICRESEAEAYAAEMARVLDRLPPGYATREMLARQWGISHSGADKVVQHLPYLLFRGRANKATRCYDLRLAERVRPPLALAVNGLTAQELADILGCDPTSVAKWRLSDGLPALNSIRRTTRWAYLYDPNVALRWLEGRRMTPRNAAFIERLRTYLNRQQEAA